MSLHSTALPLGTASVVVLLVLAATAPTAVAASTDTTAEQAIPSNGSLEALLPPQGSTHDELHSAAERGDLAPTDAVAPNGTVVFRLNGTATTDAATDRRLGEEIRFGMQQTDRSTTPERQPVRLNTSRSGDAVRTFVADGDRYVVVDFADASWGYDSEPGTHSPEAVPRIGQGYEATLTVAANGTTVSGNTTVRVTEPTLAGDTQTAVESTARLNVSVPGRWTATLVVGNESAGYRAALQVVDEDADGHVVVRFDTAAAGTDAAFTAAGSDSVRRHPEATGFALGNGTLVPGEYQLAVGVSDPETVAVERYDWEPVLVVTDATPTPTPATATPGPSPTPTAHPTPTRPGPASPTPTPEPSTTEVPGFGAVTALLGVLALGVARTRRR